MKSSFARVSRQAIVVACAVLTIVGIGYTFAAPSAPPPGSSIPLPLTRGSTAETKAGALTVQGALTASGGLAVSGGSGLCINGTCKTAWPTTTVQAGIQTVAGTQTISCYASNYSQLTYYYANYYGGGWYSNSYYMYNCSVPFSITVAASQGVPVSASTIDAVCLQTGQNGGATYSYTYPQSCYQGYYCSGTNWIAPTSVTTSMNASNQVTVSGTCTLTSNYSYYYAYGVAYANVNIRYLY